MLSEVFGNSAIVRVLDFLLDEWETDFSIGEIAKETGLTWKSVNAAVPILQEKGLILKSRTIGRAVLFRINKGSQVLSQLKTLDFLISSNRNKKIAETQKQKSTITIIRKRT